MYKELCLSTQATAFRLSIKSNLASGLEEKRARRLAWDWQDCSDGLNRLRGSLCGTAVVVRRVFSSAKLAARQSASLFDWS
jgi:hypothetical protein